jgi:hypothetical protein
MGPTLKTRTRGKSVWGWMLMDGGTLVATLKFKRTLLISITANGVSRLCFERKGVRAVLHCGESYRHQTVQCQMLVGCRHRQID